jgi:hypothetical protein
MRKGLIAILIIGALASIALCGSYGWDQATETKDRVTQAFVYGFVAMATLALHGLALRVWVAGWRKAGGFIGAIAMLAFTMTAFTSLGGLASRADKVVSARQDVLDSKADTKGQIDALVAERGALKFRRANDATVRAAQRAADTARDARIAECGDGTPKQRGKFCRQKEDGEAAANTALTEAQENKAATDRFDAIEAELKDLRAIKPDGAVGSADPLNALLAKILGTWADALSSWQKAAFAVVYDLCLVALMIGIEVLGHTAPIARPKPETPAEETPAAITPVIPAPSKPKLVATSPTPMGNVNRILTDNLEAATGERVELADIARRYREVCKTQGRKPVTQDDFVRGVETFCRAIGIKRHNEDGHLYLLDVQLTNKTVMAVDKGA